MESSQIICLTQQWLEKAVIGLNLCPFAKAVHVKQQIRYVVSAAQTASALRQDLKAELLHLQELDPEEIDTTLLIHPSVLQDFYAYNDFLGTAEALLRQLDLEGSIQIASFHPAYQFADSEADAIENYTNRAPFPMLHLLREESIEAVLEHFPNADSIYLRNIERMRRLGLEGWRRLGLNSPEKQ